jgi:hypothetical protein
MKVFRETVQLLQILQTEHQLVSIMDEFRSITDR